MDDKDAQLTWDLLREFKSADEVAAEIDAAYVNPIALALTPEVDGLTTAEVQEVVEALEEELTDRVNSGELQTATDVVFWLRGGGV